MRYYPLLTLQFLMASVTLAGPMELVVDETRSSAAVELCLTLTSTVCDTDTTPIGGSVTLAFDCPTAPGEMTLHDFVFRLTEEVTLDLNFGAGQNIELRYATPGSPMPPVPVVGGAFSAVGVPAQAAGQLQYQATGFVCTLFTLGGYPCDDAIDLATLTLNPLDINGTVDVTGGYVELTVDTEVTAPVDPDNPGLGTIDIAATMVASGIIPPPCCPGDMTGDDRVDLTDHVRFAACLAGPQEPPAGACQCADLDGDDDVDLRDWADFQVAFEGL